MNKLPPDRRNHVNNHDFQKEQMFSLTKYLDINRTYKSVEF